jgi:hypothetical protein
MVRENKLNTIKSENGIKVIKEKYQNNPFSHWKNNLARNNSMLVASIPFVRNLAEYTGHNSEFIRLTSLLHHKSDTLNITIADLETVIKSILVDQIDLSLPNPTKTVVSIIYECADAIEASTNEIIELEDKIVLAIAIRLKSEVHMINAINDSTFIQSITSNQTNALITRYRADFASEIDKIQLLQQVNLMTPENIHLNSFMYEPILDMSNGHLKQLYTEVKAILP